MVSGVIRNGCPSSRAKGPWLQEDRKCQISVSMQSRPRECAALLMARMPKLPAGGSANGETQLTATAVCTIDY